MDKLKRNLKVMLSEMVVRALMIVRIEQMNKILILACLIQITLLLEMQTFFIFKLRLYTSYLHENRPYILHSLNSMLLGGSFGVRYSDS